MTQNKGYVISWPSWKMQPDPSPSSTSQKQKILRISELSPIYLPKSSHQENVCVEISPGYFPHKFHFLFILLTNSVFPTVSKLSLLFSYMFIDDFTLLVLYLFWSDCWNCFLSMCSVFCLGLFSPHWAGSGKGRKEQVLWGWERVGIQLYSNWKYSDGKYAFPAFCIFNASIQQESILLPCIASYLTSFYFSQRSAASLHFLGLQDLYNIRCCFLSASV